MTTIFFHYYNIIRKDNFEASQLLYDILRDKWTLARDSDQW